MVSKRMAVGVLCSLSIANALADGGPLGIDHRMALDDHGIWSRHTQKIMFGTLITSEILSGLWQGGETRLGRTNWQSIDAMLISAVSTEVLKRTFRRVRPADTDNPNEWFHSGHDRSFPSGEVATFAAAVTPLILEYHQDQPWVYALAALPVWDGLARMKTRGHWQTDVLAGMAVGTAAGWYSHGRNQSFTLQIMPQGIQMGLRGSF